VYGGGGDNILHTYTGADVEITESYVNFGNIACGTSSAHLIHIKNNSLSVKAFYQVTCYHYCCVVDASAHLTRGISFGLVMKVFCIVVLP